MATDRKTKQRQKLRQQGLRPLEVWLPQTMIDSIDDLKGDGEGRDTIIAKILAENLSSLSNAKQHSRDQMSLAI